ncbi:MAG: hypothetical protein Q8P13_01370 [bacterium]|nr:hypothetical protein [bacterium]
MDWADGLNIGLFSGLAFGILLTAFIWWRIESSNDKIRKGEKFRAAEPFLKKEYYHVAYRAFSEFDRLGWKRGCQTWVGFVTFFKADRFHRNPHIVELLEEVHTKLAAEFHGRVMFAGWDVVSNQYLIYPKWTFELYDKKGKLIAPQVRSDVAYAREVDHNSAQQEAWQNMVLARNNAESVKIFYPDGEIFRILNRPEFLRAK